jgi:hypothetical protein
VSNALARLDSMQGRAINAENGSKIDSVSPVFANTHAIEETFFSFKMEAKTTTT